MILEYDMILVKFCVVISASFPAPYSIQFKQALQKKKKKKNSLFVPGTVLILWVTLMSSHIGPPDSGKSKVAN